jgi:predicted nucleic acid-binding protein
MSKRRLYLDSSVFLAYLNGNETYSPQAKSIVEAAQSGDVEIWTSYLTMAEVTKRRGVQFPRPTNDELNVTEMFQNPVIKYVTIDYVVGTYSQQIIWDFQKQPRDALHLASAVFAKCEIVYAIDGGMFEVNSRTSQRIKVPEVRCPEFQGQPPLPL